MNQNRIITSVGRPGEGVGSAANAGSVVQIQNKWFSTKVGGYRTVTQAAVGASSETGDHFGQTLTADGDGNLIIGDPGEDLGTIVDAGMAPIVSGSNTVNGPVSLLQTLSFPGRPAHARYGAVLPAS